MHVLLCGQLEAQTLHLFLKVHDLSLQLPVPFLLSFQSKGQGPVVSLQRDLEKGGGIWYGQIETSNHKCLWETWTFTFRFINRDSGTRVAELACKLVKIKDVNETLTEKLILYLWCCSRSVLGSWFGCHRPQRLKPSYPDKHESLEWWTQYPGKIFNNKKCCCSYTQVVL